MKIIKKIRKYILPIAIATSLAVTAFLLPSTSVSPTYSFMAVSISNNADSDFLDLSQAVGPETAYAKIEPSGCTVRKGNVQVRIDFFLTEDDPRYEDTVHEIVNEKTKEITYQVSPFHSHFIYCSPDVTEEKIKAEMAYHLPNFYLAYQNEWDKVQGGMRHGWDTATRIRPTDYTKTDDAETFVYRTLACEDKVNEIKQSDITYEPVIGVSIGKEFPATEIDIGAAATDRGAGFNYSLTGIIKHNAAEDSGVIDFVEWYAERGMSTFEVATFYNRGGTNYSTRDYEVIGTVSSGYDSASGLDMDVETGDYMGFYQSDKGIGVQFSGGAGLIYRPYSHNIPCTDTSFTTGSSNYDASVYGTGETASAEPDISNTPSSENLGTVETNSTYYAYGSAPSNPVVDGECTFTVTNNSGAAVDLDIKSENFTGGVGWVLSSSSPGEDEFRITSYYSGQNPASGIVLTASDQSFYSSLADSGTLKWDFKFETGTFTDGVTKSGDITLTASLS